MPELQEYRHRLVALVERKASEFRQRAEIVALAMTGSVARGQVWEGSDLDFWGFTTGDEDDFEDGVENGIYWEIDLQPLTWLQTPVGQAASLQPPLLKDDSVSALEALWGCHVIFDHDGQLTRTVETVNALMQDHDWLSRRAELYLAHGHGVIDGLQYADALNAIVLAREASTRYGIAAYWMQRGQLLSSVMRVPERLSEHPEIQALYRSIWNLNGQPEAMRFLTLYHALPEKQRTSIANDIDWEVRPAFDQGMYDGGLRHMRALIAGDFSPLTLYITLLGIEPDMDAQKQRVLSQTRELFYRIRALQDD